MPKPHKFQAPGALNLISGMQQLDLLKHKWLTELLAVGSVVFMRIRCGFLPAVCSPWTLSTTLAQGRICGLLGLERVNWQGGPLDASLQKILCISSKCVTWEQKPWRAAATQQVTKLADLRPTWLGNHSLFSSLTSAFAVICCLSASEQLSTAATAILDVLLMKTPSAELNRIILAPSCNDLQHVLLDDEQLSIEKASILILDDQTDPGHEGIDAASRRHVWQEQQRHTLNAAGMVTSSACAKILLPHWFWPIWIRSTCPLCQVSWNWCGKTGGVDAMWLELDMLFPSWGTQGDWKIRLQWPLTWYHILSAVVAGRHGGWTCTQH